MSNLSSVAEARSVITGAAGDIGRCLVAGLLEGRAQVLAVDRDPDALADVCDGWDSDLVSTAECDISEEAEVDRLFNNAGIVVRSTPEEIEFDQWRRLMSVNLDAAFPCARAAGRLMKSRGSGAIVNISSIASVKALDTELRG